MLPVIVLGAVLLALIICLAWFYRYSRTEAFRKGELRRATFEFLVIIGPFFGVRVKPPEPEPTSVSMPKGDTEDPNAGTFRLGGPEEGSADEHTRADGGQ